MIAEASWRHMAGMPHNEIHAHCLDAAADLSPELVEALHHVGPIILPRRNDRAFPDYLSRAIAGQQISVKAAASIWSRVEALCGETALMQFICSEQYDALRGCGLSHAKAKTLITIAQAHQTDGLDAQRLEGLTPAERAACLTELWGVGQWTADMMNIFYFGEWDIWPDGDVAARKTLERLTSKRRKTIRSAARFKPYRSWLAYYMWAYVDAPPDGETESASN